MNKPRPVHYQLVFFMRVSIVYMLLSGVTALLGYATDTNGQEVLDRKVTVEADGQQLREVLTELEKQADVKFTYRPRLIEVHRIVSIRAQQLRLGDVLTDLLGNTIDLSVIGRQIVLKPAPRTDGPVSHRDWKKRCPSLSRAAL